MEKNHLSQIAILDFGSQTTQLIATRLRSLGFYAEIHPHNISAEALQRLNPRGLIFSGGPDSLYRKGSPRPDPGVYKMDLPILGICYGLQLIVDRFGGKVIKGTTKKEYGEAKLTVKSSALETPLLKGVAQINSKTYPLPAKQRGKKNEIKPHHSVAWMSHGDEAKELAAGFQVFAKTHKSPFAIIASPQRQIYAVQFHPEVSQSEIGNVILANFAQHICRMPKNWQIKNVIEEMKKEVKEKVGQKKVLHAISGGVDSTVMAAILHEALGDQLRCVMVDTGLLRKDEVKVVQERFKKYLKTKVEIVDASTKFLKLLKGVTNGQERRKIIGKAYIDIFEEKLGPKDILAQGTLYPDVIESAADVCGPAHTIKTHHNRAPEVIKLMKEGRVLEIFKDLFKNEVRAIGKTLGLPPEIVQRQPFPGPGLGIRILGEITSAKLKILKEADAIVIEELKKAKLYYKISQTVVALDSHQVTCVKGDAKESGYLIFIRNVATYDFMTASPYYLPENLRKKMVGRVLNEVKGVGRVLFDESTKPPATICYL